MAQLNVGDHRAFERLLERHGQSIHAFLRRLCGNSADAEDLMQETFLKVWRHADQWRPGTVRLTTWLHRIARNLCIDAFRSKKRRPQEDESIDSRREVSATEMTQEENMMQKERLIAVSNCVADLPERQRTALVLCQYQGMSNREAAVVMEVSTDALESLLSRARRRLREQLSGIAAAIEPNDSATHATPPTQGDVRLTALGPAALETETIATPTIGKSREH